MSKISDNPQGHADYVLEISKTEYESLKKTAKAADGQNPEVEQAREIVMYRASSIEQGESDIVFELSEGEAEALIETARDADGRKSEVKHAREILGIR